MESDIPERCPTTESAPFSEVASSSERDKGLLERSWCHLQLLGKRLGWKLLWMESVVTTPAPRCEQCLIIVFRWVSLKLEGHVWEGLLSVQLIQENGRSAERQNAHAPHGDASRYGGGVQPRPMGARLRWKPRQSTTLHQASEILRSEISTRAGAGVVRVWMRRSLPGARYVPPLRSESSCYPFCE